MLNNYKWNVIFKKVCIIYCIPVTYIILYVNSTSIKEKELCTGNSGASHCCASEAEHSTERKVVQLWTSDGVATCIDSTSRFQDIGLRANHLHETCLQQ